MGCNDYNLHLDSSEGNESPTPEYNIYLDGVGVNGYSPTIDIVNSTSSSFQIQTNDINGSELTSPIPKLDYITNNYVSNTSLASTLTGYLQVDGSNADNTITINGIKLRNYSNYQAQLTTDLSSLNITNTNGGFISIASSGTIIGTNGYLTLGNGNASRIMLSPAQDGKAYYGSTYAASNEIATIGDIGNGTITLTQGGVTKGTFTTNQSGNTTINLDAGGGSITNPLEIVSDNGNQSIFLGFEENSSKVLFAEELRIGGITSTIPLHAISSSSNPITLTTNNTSGLTTIELAYDSNTLEVNQDGELTVVGGGGGSYTAGTGIDITSDVISIDTDIVAQVSDIPDTTYMVTTNTAQTISGVKTFSSETHHLGVITFDSAMLNPIIRGMSGSSYRNMIYRMGNDSAIIVGNSNDTIDLKGSGTRPTYNSGNLALYSDIPTNSTYVDLTSAQTITGKKTFSGAEIETNNIITLKNNAIIRGLHSGSYSTYLSSNSTSLLLGNESNNIKLRGNTARPVYRTGGTDYDIALSNDIPSISNLADKDLSNLSSTGKAVMDGQWVVANQVIGSNEAVGSYVIDLSNVLPVDNYKYEVILSLYMYAIAIDVYYQSVETTFFPPTALNTVTGTGTYPTVSSTTATMIIDTDKYFKYSISSNGNTTPDGSSLTLVAYRRIGTNS